jgi:hypothetical protein
MVILSAPEKHAMPQKSPNQSPKKKPSQTETTHTHVRGASGGGKDTFLAATLKSISESGTQVGIVDPHGDIRATKRGRPSKTKSHNTMKRSSR